MFTVNDIMKAYVGIFDMRIAIFMDLDNTEFIDETMIALSEKEKRNHWYYGYVSPNFPNEILDKKVLSFSVEKRDNDTNFPNWADTLFITIPCYNELYKYIEKPYIQEA